MSRAWTSGCSLRDRRNCFMIGLRKYRMAWTMVAAMDAKEVLRRVITLRFVNLSDDVPISQSERRPALRIQQAGTPVEKASTHDMNKGL